MKKLMNFKQLGKNFLLCLLTMTACQKESEPTSNFVKDPGVIDVEPRSGKSSQVVPINAKPFGKSYADWTQEWWRYMFSFPCESNPILDPTGANAAQNQNGPVFFLAGTSGGPVSRTILVRTNKAILFPLINYINDYPCPDANFKPSEDQTLEEFLQAGAKAFIDMAGEFKVELDGTSLSNLQNYRVPTKLFTITGHTDLVDCFDPCITGDPQDAVSDGYWIMLKPLSKGKHTLHFHGEIPAYGFVVDASYTIYAY